MECTLLRYIFLLFILAIVIHEIHAQGIPGQVQNLNVIATTPETIEIEWEPPAPQDPPITIEGYELQIGESPALRITDVTYNFIGLKSCLNYDISVKAYSVDSTGDAAETSGRTSSPTTMTDQPIGAKVEYDIEIHAMVLSWQPPPISEACITDYRINYYGTGGGTDTVTTTDTSDTKNDPVACRTYAIDIIAKIGASVESRPTRVDFSIPGRATNPPVYVPPYVETWDSATIQFTVDQSSVNLCKLQRLYVECEALPEDNENAGDETVWNASGETELIGFPTSPQSVIVAGMSEFTNYTCVGYVDNEIGRSAASEEIKMITKLGPPDPPEIIGITDVTATSFTVSWTDPINLPGSITKFEVIVTPIRAEYLLPPNCVFEKDPIMIDVEPNIFEHNFAMAKPDYSYDVQVAIYNDDDHSTSNTVQTTTLTAPSEAPRLWSIATEINEDTEDYDVNINIEWLLHCLSNDVLLNHVVAISGARPNYPPHEDLEEIPIDDLMVEIHQYSFVPNPAYLYSVSIREDSQEHEGQTLLITDHLAPSGVPPTTSVVLLPPSNDTDYPHSQALFQFGPDLFDNTMGDVLYYSIILGTLGNEEVSKWGYWNGTDWPDLGGWSDGKTVDPYEATPIEWNPFVGGNDGVEIVLGKDVCENGQANCNGPLKPETEYTVKVRGFTSGGYKDTITVSFTTMVRLPPLTIKIIDETETSFLITWGEPTIPGTVQKFEVTVTKLQEEYLIPPGCETDDQIKVFEVDPDVREYLFEEAIPFTTYEAVVAIINEDGKFTSDPEEITTLTSASESPRFGTIDTEINKDTEDYDVNINIEWLLPCLSNDVLLNHVVAVTGARPNYPPHVDLEEIPIGDIMADVHQYSFVSKPAFLYSISIKEDSQDHEGQAFLITDYLAPSGVPPTTSVIILPPTNDTDYPHSQALFQFGSDLFDNTMGDVLYYSIILGTPGNEEVSKWGYWNGTDWPDLGSWSDSGTVEPYEVTPVEWNPFADGSTAVSIVLGEGMCDNGQPNCNGPLKPETEYTIKMRAFTSGGYKDTITVSFTTTVQLPPLIIEIINETETSFLIIWGEPTIPGTVQKFEVTVAKIQEKYVIPPGCEVDEQTVTIEVNPDVREYLFVEAIPFTTYKTIVAIINGEGRFPSDPAQIATLSSAPDLPRFLNESTDINQETDAYNVSVKLEWSLPCLSNDNLLQHVISIRGERQDYVTDEILEEIPIEDFTIETFDYSFAPSPAYSYKISIREDSENHEGKAYEILDFLAPSGVPPSTTVTVPTPSNDTDSPHIQALLIFEANLFDPDLGDIIYYSIILGTPENEEATTWGYWDGENWPQLGGWNEAEFVEPYEATPVKWNPFREGVTTAAFTIGVAECENGQPNCNGALQPETEYTVKVRGFTSAGYRDRESVTFITQEVPETTEAPAPEGTTSEPVDDDADPAIIWGSVGGILLILLIAVLIFFLWKKRVFNRCTKGKSVEVAY